MIYGVRNLREFREIELDMLVIKEQARNMVEGDQEYFFEDSKLSNLMVLMLCGIFLGFLFYFVFFA